MNKQVSLLVMMVIAASGSLAFAQAGDDQQDPTITPQPRSVVHYSVASPRACLVPGNEHLSTGAVENFARKGVKLRVRQGTTVMFDLHRELEAVWYTDSFGRIASSLAIELAIPNNTTEQVEWKLVGTDRAADIRSGPSIGVARIAVPVRFKRAGEFRLRAIVRTSAQPLWPGYDPNNDTTEEDPNYPIPEPSVATDIIPIVVKVVDVSIDTQPDDDIPAPAASNESLRPMPKEHPQGFLRADVNNDGVVNWDDFAVLAGEWSQEAQADNIIE